MSDERMVGRRIGDFEILEAIGAGGMGSVYKARSVTLDRMVAVKVLSEKLSGDQAFVQRFLKEARAVARLNHPGIVQIYDFGEADSIFYLVMEYIDGHSVAHLVRSHGTIPAAQSIGLVRQACLALATAHEAGIVHRDVKPDNLMLTRHARIKLIDLGLARLVDEDLSMTMTGVTMGTPLYIAPEQIHGKAPVDRRADIYSLGATFFHMVTGHPPFPAASGMNVLARHLVDPLPDPRSHVPGLSAGLCRVIGTMMAKNPADRFGDMTSVERELAALAPEPSGEAFGADACTVVYGGTFETSRGPSVPSPSGSPPPVSIGEVPSGWDSAVLRTIEEQLAAEIGPLAKVLVRRTAREATSLESLCRKLGEQIPASSGRSSFLRSCSELMRSSPAGSTPPAERTFAPSGKSTRGVPPGSPAAASMPSLPAAWSETDIKAIETELSACIGPLAKLLVKKEAKRASSLDELAASLAEQIDDERKRDLFRSALRRLG